MWRNLRACRYTTCMSIHYLNQVRLGLDEKHRGLLYKNCHHALRGCNVSLTKIATKSPTKIGEKNWVALFTFVIRNKFPHVLYCPLDKSYADVFGRFRVTSRQAQVDNKYLCLLVSWSTQSTYIHWYIFCFWVFFHGFL